jgi:AcrR family transcriptional regulator
MVHSGSLASTHEGVRGLPRGRSRLPVHTVLAAQRERLIRAMIAAVASDGYAGVTVGDVVRRARVSRTAFYAHFSDKEDCFFAATGEGRRLMFDHTLGAVQALPPGSSDEELLRTGLRAFLGFLASEPEFARVFYIELPTAGRRAEERLESAHWQWAHMNRLWHKRARDRHTDWPEVPWEAYLALAGGVAELVRERVRRDEVESLPELEEPIVALHLAVLAGRSMAEAVG